MFCFSCGKTTGGEPQFCNQCGCSYNVKLCPRLHKNPRNAEACSRCGSRNLSTPQPRVPVSWRLIATLLVVVTGILLAVVSVVAFLQLKRRFGAELPHSPWDRIELLLIALFWSLWRVLPDVLRTVVHRLLKKRHNRDS